MGACAAPLIQRLGALLAGGVSRETVCPRRAVQVCCKGCLQRRRRAPDKGGKIAGFPQRGLRAGRRGGPLRRVLGGCLARIWPVWCVWCVSLWAGGGVTIASDCDAEYQECFDKVGNLLGLLQHND